MMLLQPRHLPSSCMNHGRRRCRGCRRCGLLRIVVLSVALLIFICDQQRLSVLPVLQLLLPSLPCRPVLPVVVFTAGHDVTVTVPTKKAMPPLMDPIPTLPEITHRIYMDIRIGNDSDNSDGDDDDDDDGSINEQTKTGRIIIGLFGKNAPTAAENFRLLSTCTTPTTGTTTATTTTTTTTTTTKQATHRQRAALEIQQQLTNENKNSNIFCYKDTIFHRVIPNFAIQGGDTTHYNGIGGIAAIAIRNDDWDHDTSNNNNNNDDESLSYRPYMINATNFNRPYMVAVATPNSKPAKSQFFITTVKAQWLTQMQYTIFGMILEGRDYIHTIEQITGTYGGRPKHTVNIVDCGELPLQPHDKEPHY